MREFKALKTLVGVVVILLSLSACADVNYETVVTEDSSVTIKYELQVNRAELDKGLAKQGLNPRDFEKEFIEEQKKSSGLEIKEFNSGLNIGYTATFKGKIEDLAPDKQSPYAVMELTSEDTLKITLPINNLIEPFITGLPEDAQAFTSFDVSVSFPGNVEAANFEGHIFSNTVTWNLEQVLQTIERKEPLIASGSMTTVTSPFVIAGIGAALFAFVIIFLIIIVKVLKKSKHKKHQQGLAALNQTQVNSAQDWASQQVYRQPAPPPIRTPKTTSLPFDSSSLLDTSPSPSSKATQPIEVTNRNPFPTNSMPPSNSPKLPPMPPQNSRR